MSKKSKYRQINTKDSSPQAPSPISIAWRGEKAFKKADYQQAIQEWSRVLEDPDIKPSLRDKVEQALAEAYFRYGQHILFADAPRACELIESAAKLCPGDPLYAYHTGLAFHRHARFEEAITWYQETLRRDPDYVRARYPLALALTESGQDATRDPIWNELDTAQQARLKCLPGNDHLAQGLLYISQENWDSAQAVLGRALEEPISLLAKGLAHYYLGVLAMRLEDKQKALEHWQRAHDLGLATNAISHNLASLYSELIDQAIAAGDTGRAASFISLCQDIVPEYLPENTQYTAQFMSGYSYARQGRWKEALTSWKDLKEIPGAQGRTAAANVAVAYEKLGEWEQAAESWREFARRRSRKTGSADWLPPDQVARLWSRIAALYMKAGMPEESASTLQNAIKYQPDDPVLLLALAHSYIDQERYEAAENRVDEVLSQSPQNGEALMLKATLAEIKPFWMSFFGGETPGVKEWERVEQLNDETYTPIARQRLEEIYEEDFDRKIHFRHYSEAAKTARKRLERKPDDPMRRALFIRALIASKAKKKEIERHVEQLDLTNEDALHQLIDGWHDVRDHREAQKLLDRAEKLKPLTPGFLLSIAECAFDRDDVDIAESYLAAALDRAHEPLEHKKNRVKIGHLYMSQKKPAKAKSVWEAVLEEDRYFGPALHAMSFLAVFDGDLKQARRYLTLAERWAQQNSDTKLLEAIAEGRSVLSELRAEWGYDE